MANDEFREQQQASREVGLKARHETRVERAREREELAALRALWWFIGDGMGFTDGGDEASLTWAEANELTELHDAVEAIYQRQGYPPKPEETS